MPLWAKQSASLTGLDERTSLMQSRSFGLIEVEPSDFEDGKIVLVHGDDKFIVDCRLSDMFGTQKEHSVLRVHHGVFDVSSLVNHYPKFPADRVFGIPDTVFYFEMHDGVFFFTSYSWHTAPADAKSGIKHGAGRWLEYRKHIPDVLQEIIRSRYIAPAFENNYADNDIFDMASVCENIDFCWWCQEPFKTFYTGDRSYYCKAYDENGVSQWDYVLPSADRSVDEVVRIIDDYRRRLVCSRKCFEALETCLNVEVHLTCLEDKARSLEQKKTRKLRKLMTKAKSALRENNPEALKSLKEEFRQQATLRS